MRVLLVHAPPALAAALAELPNLDVAVLAESPAHAYELAASCPHLPLDVLPTRSKVDWAARRRLRDAIRAFSPDLVHAFYGKALANTLPAARGGPPVVSFRGVQRVPSYGDPGELVSYLHPRVRAHGCESQAVAQALGQAGIPSQRCETLYNCLDADRLPRPGRAALDPWQLPRQSFRVGTVATMRPIKGLDLLLRAAIACRDLDQLYFVLIGPVRDPQITRLVQHAALRHRVRLLGFRPDAAALASGLDVFVMPSRQEALCRALLEAMAQGVCPVVSDAGGMKEAVRQGQDGYVVPRGDVLSLAEALRELYFDRQRAFELGRSAALRVRAEFSPARMALRTRAFYQRILGWCSKVVDRSAITRRTWSASSEAESP